MMNAVMGAWTTPDAKTSVLISPNKITVVSNCVEFNFAGTWAIDENQNIIRLVDGNSLVIAFVNEQLNFEIKNNKSELVSSGLGLNKVAAEVLTPLSQCSK
jgi:hypothetical protein